ncbi:MAG: xanthine dehydrogenase family protein subunit M [Bacillota bacterium]|nr:xanthine dehydrogenase family protein subunit M [Bacillota bacterium]
MKNFTFIPAPDLKTALNILDREKEKAKPVAGATNIMVDIRDGKLNDKILVGIQDIKELRGVKFNRGKIYIGALTTISELADSLLLEKKAPALFQAAQVFADPIVRNSATVGGNIAYGSPAGDAVAALMGLKADVIVARKGGKRRIPIEEFHTGVNKNVMAANELIVAVEFAVNPHSAFYKLALRNSMAISQVTVAVSVRQDRAGKITDAVIALGAVAPKVVRAYSVEKAIIGKPFGDEVIAAIAPALKKDIKPIDDIRGSGEYRATVAPVLVKRVLAKACGVCLNEGRNAK